MRLTELLAVFALATDVGMAQPMGHSLRAALIAHRLAQLLGIRDEELRRVFHLTLVRRIGCTSDAHDLASWFGDDVQAHARALVLDFGDRGEILVDIVRFAGADQALLGRIRTLAGVLAGGEAGLSNLFRASCEVAERLATRVGIAAVARDLRRMFERWDGRGYPDRLSGEEIPLAVRIAQVAELAEVQHRAGGLDAAVAAVTRRSGRAFDPEVVEVFRKHAGDIATAADEPSPWSAVLAAEPAPHVIVDEATIDAFAETAADFVDLKSPWFASHSSSVASLTARACGELGISGNELTCARRAALLHDLGRVAVPNSVWEKRAALSEGERELVRLHPYHTERILAHSSELAPLGKLAGAHHENLDASGYYRGAKAAGLPMTARLLAAADRYAALVSDRPHRRALAPAGAASALRDEVRLGKLDRDAVEAVLAASGHRAAAPRLLTDRLTPREIEVLRLVARGSSKAEIAAQLNISRHTADHHIRHVYEKIGVRTRAAATLHAMEHGLLDPLLPN